MSLKQHIIDLKGCTLCPNMVGPVVTHTPVISKVYLCGQAPGPHEGKFGKPFAWTAGKTLFRWFQRISVSEEDFRSHAYMAAVCRCFPGKDPKGGDRVPSDKEINLCSRWITSEFELLKPDLVIPVGRLAIEQFLPKAPLVEIVGRQIKAEKYGHKFDLIALPHPSGASTWFKKDPGLSLLEEALQLLAKHKSWKQTFYDK